MTAYDAVVVGAGHNGLVCAASLARAGRRVLVVERADRVGGVAATVELTAGYRAPAVLADVGRLRRSVVRDLGLERHGLRLLTPKVAAFAPDPDGGGVALHADPERTAEELKARSPQDAEAYPGFDRRVRSIASFLAHVAAATPPDLDRPSMADALLGLRLGRAFRRLGDRAGRETLRVLPMPVADLVGDVFETDPLRALLSARGVALTAMGPWTPGSAGVFMTDAVAGGGAAGAPRYAEGGPGAVADALERAARAAGAEVRSGAEVVAVTSRDGRATGVALASGEEIAGRAVVSAADPKRTLSWVDPVVAGPTLLWRGRHIRSPGSVGKVNLALSGLPAFRDVADPAVLTGRIVVGSSIDHLERAADDRKYGRVSEAPWLEMAIPSLTDPTLAPEGGHVASILVHHAPYRLRRGGWDGPARDRLGDVALETLEAYAPGVSGLVEARQVLAPPDLEHEYGLTEGCILHAEPGLDQFFAWRPLLGHARYRFGIPGLYLAGSGAHPGGGITGAPGANAAREILFDLRH
ncbi:MAG: phytoene desaturase family protein [Actinomycetota bacterium]